MRFVEYELGTVKELDEVAQQARDLGSRCLSSVCDVRRPEQVKELVDRTIDEFGRIDVLISNAGIATISKVVDMPQAQWAEMIETNLNGSFHLCKYALPHMVAAEVLAGPLSSGRPSRSGV